jgi:anti-anti-sigma factor
MLQVSIEDRQRIIILHLEGDFFIDKLNEIEKIWHEQVSKKPRVIALDCSGIDHIDSSAISTLVKFLNEAMNRSIRLIFYDLNPSVQKLFEIARLQRFFTITTRDKFESKFLQTA